MKSSFLAILSFSFICSFAQNDLHQPEPTLDSIQFENIQKTKSRPIKQAYNYDSLHKPVVGLQEIKNDKIDLLIQDYNEHKKFSGYRIQIFSSTTRWEAVKERSEFLKKYENATSYLLYQAPNFKVRVGDYQNRLKAHELLELYKIDYPSAFIVKDEIEPQIE